VQGEVSLGDAPRLAAQLADLDGALRYRFNGLVDDLGRPAAVLAVQGECGSAATAAVARSRFRRRAGALLLREGRTGTRRAANRRVADEPLLGSHRFDLAALVEEQAILALLSRRGTTAARLRRRSLRNAALRRIAPSRRWPS